MVKIEESVGSVNESDSHGSQYLQDVFLLLTLFSTSSVEYDN